MNPRDICFLAYVLFFCVVSAKSRVPTEATKDMRKSIPKSSDPSEVKPSRGLGHKKPQKADSQKVLEAPRARKSRPQVETQPPGALVPSPPSILIQVVGKGQFQKVGDSLSLRAGDALELRCRGKSVHWRFPVYLEEEGEGRLRIKHFTQYSQLLVMNSTIADTGEYSCWSRYCQDSECRDVKDRTNKTFVFFTDQQELFVPTEDYYEVVQLRTNQPTLLPCQVTSPEAQVTLHREFPPEEVAVDGVDISFDAKKGFTIHRPRASLAGSLFCMASLGGIHQISTKYILIYINYPSSSPKPTIQASATSVPLGEHFNVTCTALGEPEITVDFTWEYPGQLMGRPPYVSECSTVVRRAGQVQQEWESVLYVEEARAKDQGIYTCRATNLQGTSTASTRIRILQPSRILVSADKAGDP
ncbi:platelet-derived growth factor receptor-like protein [Monodelphis domestica]|uniref:Platelet-derived growth factor receptor-like protein n=1 Tax=Monodelphis domestica TaxID=13616 RepID=F7DB56_MONDO|nr:platelet-derived growth factor receptor-like protein [Monodelphis domestica]